MRIIEPSFAIEDFTADAVERIERVARTCHQSEGAIGPGTARRLVRKLIRWRHFAMFDHVYASVRVICDRGVSHEIVRGRIGVGYAQKSTRYVDYLNEVKCPDGVAFIRPFFFVEGSPQYDLWLSAMKHAEDTYFALRALKSAPEKARSVLPNSTATEMVITGDFSFWRHFFEQRAAKAAHPQMRQLVVPMLDAFAQRWPEVFEDLRHPSILDRALTLLRRWAGDQGEVDILLAEVDGVETADAA